MVIRSTVPLSFDECMSIRDAVREHQDAVYRLLCTGDCMVSLDYYRNWFQTSDFNVVTEDYFFDTDNYLLKVFPRDYGNDLSTFIERGLYTAPDDSEFVNFYEWSEYVPGMFRKIENPHRYWSYLTDEGRESEGYSFEYQPGDETWMDNNFNVRASDISGYEPRMEWEWK